MLFTGLLRRCRRAYAEKPALDAEAFAAAALALDIRVIKLETFVDAGFDKVHFGSIDIHQTFWINHDLDAVVVKNLITGRQVIHELEHIGHARAAGCRYANPDA